MTSRCARCPSSTIFLSPSVRSYVVVRPSRSRRSLSVVAFRTVDHSTRAQSVLRYLHALETSRISALTQIAAPTVTYREQGLLHNTVPEARGLDNVFALMRKRHHDYIDLVYSINTFAEEGDKLVLHWTATGMNHAGMFNKPPTYQPSVFSGATWFGFDGKGRIASVTEYRQPTREEISELLVPEAVPKRIPTSPVGDTSMVCLRKSTDASWKERSVQACSSWFNLLSSHDCSDLERFVAPDVVIRHSSSWPYFSPDGHGHAGVLDMLKRAKQVSVYVEDLVADSASNQVAALWTAYGSQGDHHSGITLFGLTDACQISKVTCFRELTMEEKSKYLRAKQSVAV